MKKSMILLAFVVGAGCVVDAQSKIQKILVRDHRDNTSHQDFKIITLKAAVDDGKFERALTQADVIGNDYNGSPKIYGRSANADGSSTPTNYVPVDGTKRTFCGPLHNYYFSGGFIDKDYGIEIDVDPNDKALKQYENVYLEAKKVNSFFEPWNRIEGEINVDEDYRDHFPNPQGVIRSNLCLYGPWVIELFDPRECCGNHKNNNEIHPAEQFWFQDKAIGAGNISYSLNFFVDNSGRFDQKSDFYGIPPGTAFQPWSKAPLDGAFYLAFEVDVTKKQRLTYWTEAQSSLGASPGLSDGSDHYLTSGKDTLVEVHEGHPEQVAIDFINVGYKPMRNGLTDKRFIRGFLRIGSRITGPRQGNLRLRVERASRFTGQTVGPVNR